MLSGAAPISTMSFARLLLLPPQFSLPGPSPHCSGYVPRRITPQNLKLKPFLSLPHPWRISIGCSRPSSSSSDSVPINEAENGELDSEERELREVVSEILEEAGVSKLESVQIAANSPQYAKMLRDAVRDLDELSLWDSWMGEKQEGSGGTVPVSFKEKVKHIAKEKGDNGKIPYLESAGLSLSTSVHLARLLSSESLPSLIQRVKYVKEIFFSGNTDAVLSANVPRRMMLQLSIPVDEDVQQTLSFFEKIEARRGGLEMLGSCDASFGFLIESFPLLLLLPVESKLKPKVKYLEDIGVPTQKTGHVLLLFPPLLFLDINRIKAALEPLRKVGVVEYNVGRILLKYPWVLSKSIRKNYEKIFNFFAARQVPEASIHHAIRDWPLILGCSVDKMKPMVEQFDELGVRKAALGKVICTSPQLLYRKPEEFQKVVSFLLDDLGLPEDHLAQVLVRCPKIFAGSIENTFQKKVEFLTKLGIRTTALPGVIKKNPEFLLSDVDRNVIPRLAYLMQFGLSTREIASMVARFSPLLTYSIKLVLRPKLDFLLNIMGKPVSEVVRFPRYFSYSLENKIKPRFFALRDRNINCSLQDMLGKNDEEFAAAYLGIEYANVDQMISPLANRYSR